MLRKPIELPPEIAKAFVRNMRAFLKENDGIKRDEIAASTSWLLKEYLPRGAKLRLTDLKEMFHQMPDHA